MLAKNDGKLEVSVGSLIMLGATTVVATGIVFLLGIYVGKGITEQRLAQEQRVVRLPAGEPGAATGSGEVEVTFWDRLNKGDSGGGAPAATPEPTATELAVRVAPPTAVASPPPTPAPAPTMAPRAAIEGGTFQVQVTAVAERASAEKLVRELETKGYDAEISPAKVGGKTLYRVRVGKFPSDEAARQAVAKLRSQGYPRAFVAAEAGGR